MLYDVVVLESDTLGYVKVQGTKRDFNGRIVAVLASNQRATAATAHAYRITALIERPPSEPQP